MWNNNTTNRLQALLPKALLKQTIPPTRCIRRFFFPCAKSVRRGHTTISHLLQWLLNCMSNGSEVNRTMFQSWLKRRHSSHQFVHPSFVSTRVSKRICVQQPWTHVCTHTCVCVLDLSVGKQSLFFPQKKLSFNLTDRTAVDIKLHSCWSCQTNLWWGMLKYTLELLRKDWD